MYLWIVASQEDVYSICIYVSVESHKPKKWKMCIDSIHGDIFIILVLQSRGLHVAKWDTCVYTNKKSTLPSVWPLPMDEKYDACMVRYPNTTDAFKVR